MYLSSSLLSSQNPFFQVFSWAKLVTRTIVNFQQAYISLIMHVRLHYLGQLIWRHKEVFIIYLVDLHAIAFNSLNWTNDCIQVNSCQHYSSLKLGSFISDQLYYLFQFKLFNFIHKKLLDSKNLRYFSSYFSLSAIFYDLMLDF